MSSSVAAAKVVIPKPIRDAALKLALTKVVPAITSKVAQKLSEAKLNALAERYSDRLALHAGYSRSFLHENRVHIRRFYQSMQFYGPRSSVSDSYRDIARFGNFIAVVGHAGTGKSTTLKHLCWECVEQGHAIPIFIELRRLLSYPVEGGKAKVVRILEAISWELVGFDAPTTVKALLESGELAVLLDGFDEVPLEARSQYANEILILATNYPKTQWIVSTRPDDQITSLGSIVTLRPAPLSLEKACEHVSRYDRDPERQQEFIEALQDGLYQRHSSFAVNPLLLAVLFLTFVKFRQISDHPTSFYAEVFETLCSRHDQKKGLERKLHSELKLEEFIKFVELFCFTTAATSTLVFSKSGLRSSVSKTSSKLKLAPTADKLVADLTQSISLLAEDGMDFTFMHRSLQEFLAARFIVNLRHEQRVKATQAAVRVPQQSLLLKILNELEPDVVEDAFVLGPLQEINSYLRPRVPTASHMAKHLAQWAKIREKGLPKGYVADEFGVIEFDQPDPENRITLLIKHIIPILEYLYDVAFPVHYDPPKDKEGSRPGEWWINPKTRQLKQQALAKAGMAYYRKNGHFGAWETIYGVSYNALPQLSKIEEMILTKRSIRKESAREIDDLIDNLLDEFD